MLTLYHTSHCPNCHAQEKILLQLQTQEPALQFQSINLEQSTNLQITPAIQSVPTLFINNYRFVGLMTAGEIKKWLGPENHDKNYINDLLKSSQLNLALHWLQQHPSALPCITELLANESIDMTVRLGLDVLIEQLAEDELLTALTQAFGELLESSKDSLIIDILHYLAMIGSVDAKTYIKSCTTHAHPEVQRIANELLEELNT